MKHRNLKKVTEMPALWPGVLASVATGVVLLLVVIYYACVA